MRGCGSRFTIQNTSLPSNTLKGEEELQEVISNVFFWFGASSTTSRCKNWVWSYKYSYPPLFSDLLKHTPLWEVDILEENNLNINNIEQLSYVLPKESCYLLPEKYREHVVSYKQDNEIIIDWSFCRYFWEAHVDFVDEKLIKLRNMLKNIE